MSGALANAAFFQVGWWIAVLGAGRGYVWISPLLVVCLVCVNVWLSTDPSSTIRIVLTVGLFGSLLDSALAAVGVLQFVHSPFDSPWCPPWLIALWCLFATTLTGSLQWLTGRQRTAALLGGICGPLSYVAGHQFGALRIGGHERLSLLLLSFLWAILLPLLLRWAASGRVSSPIRPSSCRVNEIG